MNGYSLVRQVHDLEKELHDMGMRWGFSMFGDRSQFGDRVAVYARDDELPIFSRDAELFTGTIDEVSSWLEGVQWAQRYDHMLGVSDTKRRQKREQNVRNAQLLAVLQTSEDKLKNPKKQKG
jgi:hypothetical protein